MDGYTVLTYVLYAYVYAVCERSLTHAYTQHLHVRVCVYIQPQLCSFTLVYAHVLTQSHRNTLTCAYILVHMYIGSLSYVCIVDLLYVPLQTCMHHSYICKYITQAYTRSYMYRPMAPHVLTNSYVTDVAKSALDTRIHICEWVLYTYARANETHTQKETATYTGLPVTIKGYPTHIWSHTAPTKGDSTNTGLPVTIKGYTRHIWSQKYVSTTKSRAKINSNRMSNRDKDPL